MQSCIDIAIKTRCNKHRLNDRCWMWVVYAVVEGLFNGATRICMSADKERDAKRCNFFKKDSQPTIATK